jgi:hypothetical protein
MLKINRWSNKNYKLKFLRNKVFFYTTELCGTETVFSSPLSSYTLAKGMWAYLILLKTSFSYLQLT